MAEGESELTSSVAREIFTGSNDDECLRRQVHPNHLEVGFDDRVARTAFTPRWKSDEPDGRMSHLRAAVAPAEAWRRYTEENERESRGTWSTQVGFARRMGLECGDDSGLPGFPEDHSYVRLEKTAGWRDVAQSLADDANARGALFLGP